MNKRLETLFCMQIVQIFSSPLSYVLLPVCAQVCQRWSLTSVFIQIKRYATITANPMLQSIVLFLPASVQLEAVLLLEKVEALISPLQMKGSTNSRKTVRKPWKINENYYYDLFIRVSRWPSREFGCVSTQGKCILTGFHLGQHKSDDKKKVKSKL